jgi:hypothetical protein
MDRDQTIAWLIRQEIAKAEGNRAACGYVEGSLEDSCLRFEIKGLRRALAFVDPNPNQ